jgi:hypothetical protein
MVGDSYKNFAEHIKKALSYAQKDSDYVYVYIYAHKRPNNTIDDDIYYIVLKKSDGTGIYFPGKHNGNDEHARQILLKHWNDTSKGNNPQAHDRFIRGSDLVFIAAGKTTHFYKDSD